VSAQTLDAAKDVAAALDPSGTTSQQVAAAIDAALKPSPGGSFIYYRVD
jgi:hypothetical protein